MYVNARRVSPCAVADGGRSTEDGTERATIKSKHALLLNKLTVCAKKKYGKSNGPYPHGFIETLFLVMKRLRCNIGDP